MMTSSSRRPLILTLLSVAWLVFLVSTANAQVPIPCVGNDVGFETITASWSPFTKKVTVNVYAVLLTCNGPSCTLPTSAQVTVTLDTGQQQTQTVSAFQIIFMTAHIQTSFVFSGVPNGSHVAEIEIIPIFDGAMLCTEAARTFTRKFHVGPHVAISPVSKM